jgi:hypothetical protein
MFVQFNVQAGAVYLVFDALFQLLTAYLIVRSTFLPRFLGVLLAIAGLGWLTFLAPPLANHLLPVLQILGVLGEGPLVVWVLVVGVDNDRWIQKAAAQSRTATAPHTQDQPGRREPDTLSPA